MQGNSGSKTVPVDGEFRILSDSSDIVNITINGAKVAAKKGATILEAARAAGIYIPSLCSHPDLKPLPKVVPDMACQLCIIEVDGTVKYFDFTTLGSQGISRRHGWYDTVTRCITQVG